MRKTFTLNHVTRSTGSFEDLVEQAVTGDTIPLPVKIWPYSNWRWLIWHDSIALLDVNNRLSVICPHTGAKKLLHENILHMRLVGDKLVVEEYEERRRPDRKGKDFFVRYLFFGKDKEIVHSTGWSSSEITEQTPVPDGRVIRQGKMVCLENRTSAQMKLLTTCETEGTVRVWHDGLGPVIGLPEPRDEGDTTTYVLHFFCHNGRPRVTPKMRGVVDAEPDGAVNLLVYLESGEIRIREPRGFEMVVAAFEKDIGPDFCKAINGSVYYYQGSEFRAYSTKAHSSLVIAECPKYGQRKKYHNCLILDGDRVVVIGDNEATLLPVFGSDTKPIEHLPISHKDEVRCLPNLGILKTNSGMTGLELVVIKR